MIERLNQIKQRIAVSAQRAGTQPDEVQIVAATKLVDAKRVLEAIECGISMIGENRLQEAKRKQAEIFALTPSCLHQMPRQQISWHFIGHLQINKVREAIRLFDLIHSVDSLELAMEIEKWADRADKVQSVLIQLNFSNKKDRFGLTASEVQPLIEEVRLYPHIKILGLMTIPPQLDDPRPYFRTLRQLKQDLASIIELRYLSMGMSDDYEIAIEEGSNMIRLGRAIFGERLC